MSQNNKVNLHSTSKPEIDEIEDLIYASIESGPTTVMAASSPSSHPSIPVSSSPFMASSNPLTFQFPATVSVPPLTIAETQPNVQATGFGSASNTLTEPVWDTVRRDLTRIVSNLKLVVFPNPFREDPGKALRDWDLWGPFFFIVFLGLILSWSASVKKVSSSFSFIIVLHTCALRIIKLIVVLSACLDVLYLSLQLFAVSRVFLFRILSAYLQCGSALLICNDCMI